MLQDNTLPPLAALPLPPPPNPICNLAPEVLAGVKEPVMVLRGWQSCELQIPSESCRCGWNAGFRQACYEGRAAGATEALAHRVCSLNGLAVWLGHPSGWDGSLPRSCFQ